MSRFWLKYTISLPAEVEEVFLAELMDSSYTLGWTEPQIEIVTTENGYDYQELQEQPVIAYVFEPMEAEQKVLVERLELFLSRWDNAVRLRSVEQVQEENESWKDEFQPIQIGSLTVAPSWTKDSLPVGADVLWIDPGAAFGTGYHATTQDMLLFLQEMEIASLRVLDIGAGSGILSLYCVKQGASAPVVTIDINPESEWEIRQNMAHNQFADERVQIIIGDAASAPIADDSSWKADLVLLNIGGEEDLAVLPVIDKRLAPDGIVIFSGLVEWNRDTFANKLKTTGYTVVNQRQTDEWVTLLARRAR